MYPDLSPKEREDAICMKYGAVFVEGIGGKLSDGNMTAALLIMMIGALLPRMERLDLMVIFSSGIQFCNVHLS